MNLIDMHCDTLWRLTDLGGRGDLLENDGSVSLRLLEKEKALAQVFACFVHRDAMEGESGQEQYDAGYQHVLSMLAYLQEQVEKYADRAAVASCPADIERIRRAGKMLQPL